MLPLLIWGAIGGLIWLSRKAPSLQAPPVQTTSGASLARVHGVMPTVYPHLAAQAVMAAMARGVPHHVGGPHGGGGHGGHGHGERWGGGWGGGLAGPDPYVDDWPVTRGYVDPNIGYAYGYAASPTDARPILTAGHGGGGGGHGGGGHGHGGGFGRRGFGGGGWGGGWWPWGSPWDITDLAPQITPVPVPVPAVTDDIAHVCSWATTSADAATLRALIVKYAAVPAAVTCLSRRLAQIAPYGV